MFPPDGLRADPVVSVGTRLSPRRGTNPAHHVEVAFHWVRPVFVVAQERKRTTGCNKANGKKRFQCGAWVFNVCFSEY